MFGEKWHIVQSNWNLEWIKGFLENMLGKQVTSDSAGQESQLTENTDFKQSW